MTIIKDSYQHEVKLLTNILVKKDNKYLVLKRSKISTHAPNMIHAFGGHIDHGENPLQAAKREIKEEIGIEIKNITLKAIVTEIKNAEIAQPDWIIFHFIADYESGHITSTHEGKLYKFDKKTLLQQKMLPSFHYVIKHIFKNTNNIMFTTYYYDQGKFIDNKKEVLFSE